MLVILCTTRCMCVNSHYLRTLFILWNGKTLFSLVHHGQRSAGSPDSPPDLESIYIRGLVENLDSLLNVTMALVWLRYDHVDGKVFVNNWGIFQLKDIPKHAASVFR